MSFIIYVGTYVRNFVHQQQLNYYSNIKSTHKSVQIVELNT